MEERNNYIGGIRQLKGVLKFSDAQLAERAKLYIDTCASLFYTGDIVVRSGYGDSRREGFITEEKKPFGEVIAEVLLDSELQIPPDEECTYNHRAERHTAIKKMSETYDTIDKKRAYCGNSETKLMQVLAMIKNVGDFEVVDYQIPTTNGTHQNIDILLERDGILYMTEAKRFASSEQLVRCVLEIETYYMKLNHRFFERYDCAPEGLKKAIMFDETSFAYTQLSYSWAKKLLDKFDITVLILSKTNDGYDIKEKTIDGTTV